MRSFFSQGYNILLISKKGGLLQSSPSETRSIITSIQIPPFKSKKNINIKNKFITFNWNTKQQKQRRFHKEFINQHYQNPKSLEWRTPFKIHPIAFMQNENTNQHYRNQGWIQVTKSNGIHAVKMFNEATFDWYAVDSTHIQPSSDGQNNFIETGTTIQNIRYHLNEEQNTS